MAGARGCGDRCGSAGRSRGRSLPDVAAQLAGHPSDRIVVTIGHPLFERDDRVIRDLDILRAHLGSALRDVAETEA